MPGTSFTVNMAGKTEELQNLILELARDASATEEFRGRLEDLAEFFQQLDLARAELTANRKELAQLKTDNVKLGNTNKDLYDSALKAEQEASDLGEVREKLVKRIEKLTEQKDAAIKEKNECEERNKELKDNLAASSRQLIEQQVEDYPAKIAALKAKLNQRDEDIAQILERARKVHTNLETTNNAITEQLSTYERDPRYSALTGKL